MKPSLGRIVLCHSPEGAEGEHPAIITKVWSDTCVNLTIFFDGMGHPFHKTSVVLDDGMRQESGWRWPPRVE